MPHRALDYMLPIGRPHRPSIPFSSSSSNLTAQLGILFVCGTGSPREVFRKLHNIDNVNISDTFVNFVFQSGVVYEMHYLLSTAYEV